MRPDQPDRRAGWRPGDARRRSAPWFRAGEVCFGL